MKYKVLLLIIFSISVNQLFADNRVSCGIKTGFPVSGGICGEYRIDKHANSSITFNPDIMFIKTTSAQFALVEPAKQPDLNMFMWNFGCKFRGYPAGTGQGVFLSLGYVLSYNNLNFDKETEEFKNKTITQNLGSIGIGYRFVTGKFYTELFSDKLFGKDIGSEFTPALETDNLHRWHFGAGIGFSL